MNRYLGFGTGGGGRKTQNRSIAHNQWAMLMSLLPKAVLNVAKIILLLIVCSLLSEYLV